MSYYHHLIKAGASYGALTTAWITATGETDPTIIGALNTLETDLTTYGLTAKIKALYPFVGGTAAKHKFNFMDARDLDAAYRLTFFGGGTHSSTGYQPNGTNAYANTFFNPTTAGLGQNSACYGAYSRTQSVSNSPFFGARNAADTIEVAIFPNYATNQLFSALNGAESYTLPYTNTNSRGLFSLNRVISTAKQDWVNGVKIQTLTGAQRGATTVSNINEDITMGALNWAGTRYYFSNRELALFFILDGLTDTEASNLYTATQAFQTTLSRQV